jgi:hypothetical protein
MIARCPHRQAGAGHARVVSCRKGSQASPSDLQSKRAFPLIDEPPKVVGYRVNCLNFVYVAIILCLDAAWLREPTMSSVDWRIPTYFSGRWLN